jgi:hypothetical protein
VSPLTDTKSQTLVKSAGSAVRDSLRDPDSARFKNLQVSKRCGDAQYVTGWVNAKNNFGGYVGFTIFLVRVAEGRPTVMQAGGMTFATDAEFHAAAVCNGDAAK